VFLAPLDRTLIVRGSGDDPSSLNLRSAALCAPDERLDVPRATA
jgi:hypothetical protein